MKRTACAVTLTLASACAADPEATDRRPSDVGPADVAPSPTDRNSPPGHPDATPVDQGAVPPPPLPDLALAGPDAGCGPATACSKLEIERLNLRVLPMCDPFHVPDGATALRVSDPDTWAEVVRTCVWGDSNVLPEVDWSTQEILGYRDDILCPFGTELLGAEACGDALVVHRWTWSDLCACDYMESETDLFLVERGVYDRVEFALHEEAPCEEIRCECGGNLGVVSGCLTGGGCLEIGSNDRDGLPPVSWGGGCRP